MSSSSGGAAAARSYGVGYLANSAGVTMLTLTSVVCADRIVAASSSYGLRWSSSQIASGILVGQPTRDLTRATLRGAGACHRAEARRLTAGTLADVRQPGDRTPDGRRPRSRSVSGSARPRPSAADGHKPLSDHLWLDLANGGRDRRSPASSA